MLIKIAKWLLILVVVAACAAAFASWRYYERYLDAAGPSTEDIIVQIPSGAGFSQITNILRDGGAINEPLLFRIHGQLTGLDTELKAGEYLVPAGISPRELLATIARGDALMHAVTVPEGLNNVQVFAIVEAAEILTGPMPDELPPEGWLLPETYLVQRGETRIELVERMKTDLQEVLNEAWANRAENLPLQSKEEALILASIIEKETALPDEYGKVSSVFINRLNDGMLLQTDPTVIFSLTEGKEPLGRELLRRDLQVDHPYNTYRYPGLPPGPIANPGRGAIQAAVNPDTTDYYYFVADGTGGHAFGKTLAEHNRNVAKWREFQRRPKPPATPEPKPEGG